MDAERYQRIRRIFLDAARHRGADREEVLDRECGDDGDLRREVELLFATSSVSTEEIALPSPLAVPEVLGPSPLAVPEVLGPYRIEREVGRGGMGVVYEAHDPARGLRVAIKTIHPWLVSTESSVERFAREARLGQRVRHENVVRTVDMGCHGGVRFLVMDFVEGRSLRVLLEELGIVPEALIRVIAGQVTAGLDAIHREGIVHRDLKPENVLITRDHRVQIMDLGVAKLPEATLDLTREGQFVGSIHYAAPEQLEGGTTGTASDLYSLGVILHELATGKNPFRADSPGAAVQAHLHHTPGPVPHLTPFLAAVIRTLLAKDPADRFDSAEELGRALEGGERSTWWAARDRGPTAPARPVVPVHRETALHGRESELEALRALWEEAREGKGSAVVLEGEPGIGKSRMVREFLAGVQGTANLLYGAYPETGGMGGLCDAVVDRFGAANLERALAPLLTETPALVPAFCAFLRRETGGAGLESDALVAMCCRLFAGLCEQHPTIWVTDDLHLAPEVGRSIARAMARTAPARRGLLLLTSRDPVPSLPDAKTIRLERLDPEDAAALVSEALPDAGSELVDRITARSDGVPWFAIEMLRGLRATGEIEEVPSAIRDLLEVRLRDLGKTERALMDVASVQGIEFDADLVASALGQPVVTVLQDLADIERRLGLVRPSGRLYRFDHQQVREMVYADLPPRLREEYHTRLARAGEEHGEGPRFLAHHHLHGRTPAEGLPHLEPALEGSEMRYLHESALDLLDRALAERGLLEGALRVRLELHRASRLDYLLRREEQKAAAEAALTLADELGDPGLQARARIALGGYSVARSRDEDALGHYEAARRLAGRVGDRESEIHALNRYGSTLARLRRDEEAIEAMAEARKMAVESRLPRQELLALINRAAALRHLSRYEEAVAELERSAEIAREIGDRRLLGHVMGNLGTNEWRLGRLEEARAHQERQIEIAREVGHRRSELAGTGNLGLVLRELGLAGRALEHFRRHRALAEEIGDRRAVMVGSVNLGRMHAEFGDFETARSLLELPMEQATAIGAPHVRAAALLALGETERAGGDAEAAGRCITEALAIYREIGDLASVAEALFGLDRLEEAEAIAEEIGLPGVRVRISARRGDAATALRLLGENESVPDRLTTYALLFRATGDPSFRAEARAILSRLREECPEQYRESLVRNHLGNREIWGDG
jgi:tetratricopeptide (TPR) repeat protein